MKMFGIFLCILLLLAVSCEWALTREKEMFEVKWKKRIGKLDVWPW